MFWTIFITVITALTAIASIYAVWSAIFSVVQKERKIVETETKIINRVTSLAYREDLTSSDLIDIIKVECANAQIDEPHINEILSGAKSLLLDKIDIYPDLTKRKNAKELLDSLKDDNITNRVRKKKLNQSIIIRLIIVIITTAILTALMIISDNNSQNKKSVIEPIYENSQVENAKSFENIVDSLGHVDLRTDHPMGGGESQKLKEEHTANNNILMLFSIILLISILIIGGYLLIFYLNNRRIRNKIIELNDRYSVESLKSLSPHTGTETQNNDFFASRPDAKPPHDEINCT